MGTEKHGQSQPLTPATRKPGERITSRHVKTVLKLHAEMFALWTAHAAVIYRQDLATRALTGCQLAQVQRLKGQNPYTATVRVKVTEKKS